MPAYCLSSRIASISAMSSPHPPELSEYRYALQIPVYWGDQDAFGHVNNTVYFRWMEIARIEYFEWAGLNELMTSEGAGPILASIKCDFRRQLNYPDTLQVAARVTLIGRSSVKMAHLIYSQQQKAVVAEGDSVIVMFDYKTQRPVRVPDSIRAKLEAVEGRSLTS
jgi:acyl-CoA thioester hydrolase